ncbi:MAG: chemotaxis protein CheA [Nitrospirota bacterium]
MEYSELIKDFLDDAYSHLNTFDGTLLLLEKNGHNRDAVSNLLGSLHTFKGNSGMMGFEPLKQYIHIIEELLKRVNENEEEFPKVLDGLFESANVIRNTLIEIGKNPSVSIDLSEKTLALQKIIKGANNLSKSVHDLTKTDMPDFSSYLGAKADTIKVNFKRLDNLLNLVGELVIFKTRLNQIETDIKGAINNKFLVKELTEGLELLGKTTAGLQDGIMKVRMLPVGYVFNKFPRLVRDLAKSQNKEIQLLFQGEDTELDKTIIDEIGEPLLHIIRNAVDHGIEPAEERLSKGKKRTGTITLSAIQESNYVIIKVADDGRGINFEKIQNKGIERGCLKEEDMLDREALLSLIFSAGFTTKHEATDISGRGIGLDVVNKNISRLNGQVLVDSTPEKGTAFTIKLPLSLAIIPALMAEAAGEVYAIPMSAVDESIKARDEDIHVINNHEVIRFRERVLPVIRLSQFFGYDGKMHKRFYLVIIGRGEKRVAIAVDRLKGKQEIVIKPLDDTFGKSYGIAGASVLGDGRIVLIVDIMAFWRDSSLKEFEND